MMRNAFCLTTLSFISIGCLSCTNFADEPESQRTLDDAAVLRRIEEYADTRKGQERAASDQRARAVVDRFLAALKAEDVHKMCTESSAPWIDRDELVRDDSLYQAKLAAFRVPRTFTVGLHRIVLMDSLEELEQALGRQVPDAARELWIKHLEKGSRIALIHGGPMVLGLSLRKSEATYSVSGLLFDYFPQPSDRIHQASEEIGPR